MANKDKESWKQIASLKGTTNRNYAVSNYGRLASYDKDLNDKLVLKPHLNGGFPLISINSNNKHKALFIHSAVAEMFLKKRNPKCIRVIHLDHDKTNNDVTNLKWVSQKEQSEHNKQNPVVLEAIARKVNKGNNAKKLNEKKVTQLKKELWDPKRKLTFKKLAEKYGIAEMNLYRIKNGELWYHIHVEGEPVFSKYKEQLKNIEFHNKKEAKATAQKVKKEAAAKKTELERAKKNKTIADAKKKAAKPVKAKKAVKVKAKVAKKTEKKTSKKTKKNKKK